MFKKNASDKKEYNLTIQVAVCYWNHLRKRSRGNHLCYHSNHWTSGSRRHTCTKIILESIYLFFLSLTIYTTNCNIGRLNLLLKHSVPLVCWVAKLNAMPYFVTRATKIKKYSSQMGIETTTVFRHTLRQDCPQRT